MRYGPRRCPLWRSADRPLRGRLQLAAAPNCKCRRYREALKVRRRRSPFAGLPEDEIEEGDWAA